MGRYCVENVTGSVVDHSRRNSCPRWDAIASRTRSTTIDYSSNALRRVAGIARTRELRLEPLADELPVGLHSTALGECRIRSVIEAGERTDRATVIRPLFNLASRTSATNTESCDSGCRNRKPDKRFLHCPLAHTSPIRSGAKSWRQREHIDLRPNPSTRAGDGDLGTAAPETPLGNAPRCRPAAALARRRSRVCRSSSGQPPSGSDGSASRSKPSAR